MKKILLKNKNILAIFLFFGLIISNQTFAQCPTTLNPDQDFCVLNNSTISDIIVTGDAIWYDSLTGGNILSPSTLLSDGTTYYADDSSGSCVTRLDVTAHLYGNPPTNVNVFVGICAEDSPIVSDLSATGTNIEWYDAQVGGNLLNPTAALVEGQYWVQQTENGCVSDRLPTTVTIIDPTPPTADAIQSFCDSDLPTIGDIVATVDAGDNLLWYDSSNSLISSSTPLVDGEQYFASASSFPCESTTQTPVTVIVDPAPIAGTDSSIAICEYDTATVDLFNQLGGAHTTGTWSGPSALTNGHLGTFDPATNTPGEYTYTVSSTGTSGACPDAMAKVNVSIITLTPPSTTELSQEFCSNASPTPTVGDISIAGSNIEWYADEAGTILLNQTDILTTGDYYAFATGASGCSSPSGFKVTVTVIDSPPPMASSQTLCSIENPTIGDLVPNGPDFNWYRTNSDTDVLLPTEPLLDGFSYWVSQTVSGCESNRTVVSVFFDDPNPPTAPPSQFFCDADNSTIADIDVTIDPGNSILWYDSTNTLIDSTTSLMNGEVYTASQVDGTTGCESTARAAVTANIDVTPDPGTDAAYTECEIDLVTTNLFDLLGTTDTTGTWTVPAGGNNLTGGHLGTFVPADNIEGVYTYTVKSILGICPDESASVTVAILVPTPPTISQTNQSFCETDNPTVADLLPSGSGFNWYLTETDTTALLATDALVNGDYWASEIDTTTGCESKSRTMVTVSIDPTPNAGTDTTYSVCEIDLATINLFDLLGTIDATGTWIVPAGANNLTGGYLGTFVPADNIAGDYIYTVQSSLGICPDDFATVTVEILIPVPPTISETTQSFCASNNPTVGDLLPTDNSYNWYLNETDTTALNLTDALTDGDYWASEIDATTGCESKSRTMVAVIIIDEVPPTINNVTQTFCESDNPTINDIVVSGNNIIWYDMETSTTAMDVNEPLIDGEDYWASQTNTATGCESAVRTVVTVSLDDPGIPNITSLGNEFCELENPTVGDLNANVTSNEGGNISWYDDFPNGNLLSLSEELFEGATYYAIEDNNGCISINPLAVTVTLSNCDTNIHKIKVFDGFSPDGDGINETFAIENLRILYPNYTVEVFNRWGNVVFSGDISEPDWDGRRDGDGKLVPTGVYYYVLNFNKENKKPIQGRIYLSR